MAENGNGQLDDVLGEEPDGLTFRALCATVDVASPNDAGELAQLADSRITRWPDSVRTVEPHWFEFDGLLASPSWPLVRGLRVTLLANEVDRPVREHWLTRLVTRPEISRLRCLHVEGIAP